MHRRLVVAPQRAHRLDVVVVAATAIGERHAERIELLTQPTDADAEDHPAAAQRVDRRDLLGGDQRVALRQDQDAGGQLDPSASTAATYASQMSGSGRSNSSAPPAILPERSYGYADS